MEEVLELVKRDNNLCLSQRNGQQARGRDASNSYMQAHSASATYMPTSLAITSSTTLPTHIHSVCMIHPNTGHPTTTEKTHHWKQDSLLLTYAFRTTVTTAFQEQIECTERFN